MAALLGRPLVLHEQNSIAGLANKVLARVADRVLVAFPDALRGAEWSGNPVRAEIAAARAAGAALRGTQRPLHLLVVGGSLGAQALNEAVPQALALLPHGERPRVMHQSGRKAPRGAAGSTIAKPGSQVEAVDFIDDMAAAYAGADLVICRAGAMTVAELAAAGVASLLVPFPHAVDDHQTANAQLPDRARGGAAAAAVGADAAAAGRALSRARPRAACWRWRCARARWRSPTPRPRWPTSANRWRLSDR